MSGIESTRRIDLAVLKQMKAQGRPIVMLTAYDYPTARIAAEAGVHALLVGDSLGNVLLGQSSTRAVPLELMLHLAAAVRRGAPEVFLVGDLPFEAMQTPRSVEDAARRFCLECGCDAVKLETASSDLSLVERLARIGMVTIAHLGLRPQQVTAPDGYRAHARDAAGIAALTEDARNMSAAGAAMLLLEAVPAEAARAVMAAVEIPVIGCGAGPDCDGHVVVTHDLLGLTFQPTPRFVPRLADVRSEMLRGMRRFAASVMNREYPAPEHVYPMKAAAANARQD